MGGSFIFSADRITSYNVCYTKLLRLLLVEADKQAGSRLVGADKGLLERELGEIPGQSLSGTRLRGLGTCLRDLNPWPLANGTPHRLLETDILSPTRAGQT